MNNEIKDLTQRIENIEKRNSKVTLDKKWETSPIRKIMVLLITYILVGLYMLYIGVQDRYIQAVIPSLGFLLSTLGLEKIKNIRMRYFIKNK